MTVIEYGKGNPNIVMLLHGGGLSWWSCRDAAQLLSERCHVVLPILDGHAGSEEPFTSIEENAARIVAYVDEHFGGQITALAGLSLGGQIAAEVLTQRSDICRVALLESTLIKPMKLTAALIAPTFGMSYGLIKQKWFAKLQFAYLRLPGKLFEEYYRDTCSTPKEDMIAFLKANSLYTVKPELAQTKAKVKIVAGAKEQKNIRDSAKRLHGRIPGSTVEFLSGLRHGELSICYPERYAAMLQEMISRQCDLRFQGAEKA